MHIECMATLAYEYMHSIVAQEGLGIAGYLQSMTVSRCFVW